MRISLIIEAALSYQLFIQSELGESSLESSGELKKLANRFGASFYENLKKYFLDRKMPLFETVFQEKPTIVLEIGSVYSK